MRLFGNLFGRDTGRDSPGLLTAIDRAVTTVEPLLRQAKGYPDHYRKPVATALDYVRGLAASVPGPVLVDRESYARDAFVHALFPDVDYVGEAICSSMALQQYLHDFPASRELYALMGMRRFEKSVVGMQLSGEMVQHDVAQQAVYFTSHTIENPAPSEQQARELVAMSFFDSLTGRVKQRALQRRQDRQAQMLEKDLLMGRLRTADARERPAFEAQLAEILKNLQASYGPLEPAHYIEDFEAVLLHPEMFLRLDQTPIVIDSMGIRRTGGGAGSGNAIMFNDLIGYDRRDWTVTMVRCSNLHKESFAAKLDRAYRRLAI
ncbi:MAG TPA: hypothetical protein VGD24_01840 [Gallionella sp.]